MPSVCLLSYECVYSLLPGHAPALCHCIYTNSGKGRVLDLSHDSDAITNSAIRSWLGQQLLVQQLVCKTVTYCHATCRYVFYVACLAWYCIFIFVSAPKHQDTVLGTYTSVCPHSWSACATDLLTSTVHVAAPYCARQHKQDHVRFSKRG